MSGQPWLLKCQQFEAEIIICGVVGISAAACHTRKSGNSSASEDNFQYAPATFKHPLGNLLFEPAVYHLGCKPKQFEENR
jgi:hypothetical protein